MKLLSVKGARAIWLFPLADLNPRGKASERNGLLEIGKRYQFATSPSPADLVMAREKNLPIRYMSGTFLPPKKDAISIDLQIYRDGIVADSRSSTADSTAFIEDLLTWACKEFGLLPHERVVKHKLAVSEVYVSTERSLSLINPKLAAFSKFLTSKTQAHAGAQFEVGSIGFWADQTEVPTKPVHFRFERAEGVSFAENRYYSIAPLDTDEHLELLDRLENLLTT
jgi:hypothetical protein